MTINVSPERSTLSLPGVRLRPDQPTLRAGPNGVSLQDPPGRSAPAVSVGRSLAGDGAALRAVTSGLDRASSAADAGLAAAETIVDLLARMGQEAKSGGRGLGQLLQSIRDAVDQAEVDGVNLLKGDGPGGALRVPAGLDGGDDLVVRGFDFRPGGPIVTVDADAEPPTAAAQIEASQTQAEVARAALGEDAKRVDAHRAFVSLLSEAVAGPAVSLDVDGARLAALSVKQTIAGTSLALSNGAPQNVLSLFR